MGGDKGMDDVQHLIDDQVYRETTTETCPIENQILPPHALNKRSFETRGIFTVIFSTLLVTLFLFTFLFIQVNFTNSYFSEQNLDQFASDNKEKTSSWTTNFVVPDDILLLEIYSSKYDFTADCPPTKFALVIYLETPLSEVKPWLQNCGNSVLYFRMNGELEMDQVNEIVQLVPHAAYIPIKADFHGVKGSPDIFANSVLRDAIDTESNIITSLRLSGYVNDVSGLIDLIPFVEELILDGSELCSSLVRKPRASQDACKVSWTELRKLKINFGMDCLRSFEYIDMCWDMPVLKSLEIIGTHINDINGQYIEDIINKYRITDTKFSYNVCSDQISKVNNFMCW